MEFYYYKVSHWKGDIPRLLIDLGGINVIDTPLSFSEKEEKLSQTDLPLLVVEGTPITQAIPIIRFLGKVSGFYPVNDIEAARVDEVLTFVEKITLLYVQSLRASMKSQTRQHLEQTVLYYTNRLNALIGTRRFVIGNSMTVGDMMIWYCYRWVEKGFPWRESSITASPFNNLKRVAYNVQADGRIAAWKTRQDRFLSYPG